MCNSSINDNSVLNHQVGIFAEMLQHHDGITGRGVMNGHTLFGGILCDKILVVCQLTETNLRGCFQCPLIQSAVSLKHDQAVSRTVVNGNGLTGKDGESLGTG